MRKAALLAAGAFALPLAVSPPAMAQQSPSAKPPQSAQQPMQKSGQQRPMQQSKTNGQNNQPNEQAAQLSSGQIKQLQQKLAQKGFKAGRPDGRLGQRTKQALSKFQQSKKLQQTGQPDPQTLQALGINASGGASGAATTGAAPSGQGPSMNQNPPPASNSSGGGNSSNGQK